MTEEVLQGVMIPEVLNATCPRGHISGCPDCWEDRRAALTKAEVRAASHDLRSRADGQTYMWREPGLYRLGSKVHLIGCHIAQWWFDNPLGAYPDVVGGNSRPETHSFRFATQYPGDIPFCRLCERRMA